MSLGEEQISFSCSMICISAESAVAHVRSPGPMASLPPVTPTSVWAEHYGAALLVFGLQRGPITTRMVKDASSSVFPNARGGFPKCPIYCPQSRTLLSIMYDVKYCVLNLVWLFSSFSYSGFIKDLCNQLLQ